MVEYLRPVRPNAAPVKMLDPYYRPLLDNRESQALEKLAAAIGNLRGPISNLAEAGLQARRNQLQMMKMEQNLQLQEQENAFKLYKAEQDFKLGQLQDTYADYGESARDIAQQYRQQAELDALSLEAGMSVTDFNIAETGGVQQSMYTNVQYDQDIVSAADEAARVVGLDLELNQPEDGDVDPAVPGIKVFEGSREQYGKLAPGERRISLDFNSYSGKTDNFYSLVVVPSDVTPEERQAASSYAVGMQELMAKYGYENYGIYGKDGVATNSEMGRGLSNTFHTEPFFAQDQRAVQLLGNKAFMQEYAQLVNDTLGTIPGAVMMAPHTEGKQGAAVTLTDGRTMFEREFALEFLMPLLGKMPRNQRSVGTTFQLRDPVSGSIIPADGTDDRASNFITAIKETGGGVVAVGPGHISGATLRLTKGEQGETGEAWIDRATGRPVNDAVIKEFNASNAVAYTRNIQAQRNAAIRADGQRRGISPARIEAEIQKASKDDLFEQQRAFLIEQKQARTVRQQDIKDDIEVKSKELAKGFEDLFTDAEIPMDDDAAFAYIRDELFAYAVNEGHSPEEVQSVLNSSFVMKSAAFTKYVDRRSGIAVDEAVASRNIRMVRTLDAELNKGRDPLDAWQIATSQQGIDAASAATYLVNRVELLERKAQTDSASAQTRQDYYMTLQYLDQLLGSGALDAAGTDIQDRAVALIKGGRDKASTSLIETFNDTIDTLGSNTTQLEQAIFAFQGQVQGSYPSMSTEDRAAYVRAMESAETTANAAVDAQLERLDTPVPDTKVEYSFDVVPVQGKDGEELMVPNMTKRSVRLSSADKKDLVNKRQQAALPQLTEDLRNLGSDDANTKSIAAANLQQGLQDAKTNGYATGLYGKLANELIAGGDITPGNIGPLVDLMTISTNSSFDFAGSSLLVAIGEVAGYQGDRRAKIGQYLTNYAPLLDVITDDHIDAAMNAYGNLPLQARSEQALQSLLTAMPQIKGNPADINAAIANSTSKTTTRSFFGRAGNYDHTLNSTRFAESLGIRMDVNVTTLPTTKKHLQAELGVREGEVEDIVSYGLDLFRDMHAASDGAKLRGVGDTNYDVFVGTDALYFGRRDGEMPIVETSFGDVALTAMTRSQGLDNLATTQVQFFDSSTQSMGSMFLLDQMGSGTFDKENVGGNLSLRVTYADGSEEVIGASPDQLIPVGTQGNDFFDGKDVGGIVYGISLNGGGREIQSVSVSFDGVIGMQPPGQVISSHSRLSLTTIHDAYNSNKIFRDFKELN